MKYADINKRFTEIVAEYMSKGYTINTATMSGSQGETAKIDLTDGTEIIRVVVDSFYECADDHHIDGDKIIVGKSTDNVKPNGRDRLDTVWNHCLEIISRERFYKIGHDFYTTKEGATKAAKIRVERCTRRRSAKVEFVPSDKALDIAVKIVREKLGYSRVNRANVSISKGKKSGKYMVGYNGKYYTLH